MGEKKKTGKVDRAFPPRVEDQSTWLKAKRGHPSIKIVRKKYFDPASGKQLKFELALIIPGQCPGDNDRVLGYDCSHQSGLGDFHRHWMGDVLECKMNQEEVFECFEKEVRDYLEQKRWEQT